MMDSILAVIGDVSLQNKAEIFLTSHFNNLALSRDQLSKLLTASQTHFVYLSTYSRSITEEYVATNQAVAAIGPVRAIARIDNRIEIEKGLFRQQEYRSRALDPDHDADLIGSGLTDEELILQLYQFHGERHCELLRGTFCYILWDDELKQVHAAIDPFNSRSLFYMQLEGLLYIASDARLLASHPQLPLTVNKRALAQWLKGRPDPFISMFNSISVLPGGHRLILTPNGEIKTASFWDINPHREIRHGSTEDYTAHFFDLLYTSVRTRMQSHSPAIFSQMSGGLDSTSITSFANKIAPLNRQELHTISHCYRKTQSCDELDKIHLMVEYLQLKHAHYMELDAFDEISFSALYPTDFDNPGIVLSPKYHQELALIKAVGADVLLTGNGGDETCWGHSATYLKRLLQGEIGVVAEVIKGCNDLREPVAKSLYSLFVRPLIPDILLNLTRIARNLPKPSFHNPAWLTKQATQLGDTRLSIANPYSSIFNPDKYARYESIKNTSTYNSMRSYQKVANYYGVDVRHPFFDQAIVEFSFAIPEKLLIQGIYPKWLLRKTMQNDLPEAVCWNKYKVIFDQHFANLLRINAEEIRLLLSHTGLQDLGLLDNEVLLKKFDELVENPGHQLNVDMLYAILTQSWFQQHCLN